MSACYSERERALENNGNVPREPKNIHIGRYDGMDFKKTKTEKEEVEAEVEFEDA